MTDDLADPQQWRDSIEARVGTLEATVKTEAHLRATMDFDMGKMQAEFRAQRSMLQALHDVQQDHTRRLTGVEGELGNIKDRLGNVEGELGNIKDRLGNVAGRLGNVEGALDLVRVGIETIHGKLDLLIDKG
jgi:hypothetical protein